MKILETRQTQEEIIQISWSNKMDLLVLVNRSGDLSLYRLSWQKVWVWVNSEKLDPGDTRPTIICWHPESIYVVAGFDCTAGMIDIETGKLAVKHDFAYQIRFLRWSSTSFETPNLKRKKTKCSPKIKHPVLCKERDKTESMLSVMLVGTNVGIVYVYASGVMLILNITIPTFTDQILMADIDYNFERFQCLAYDKSEGLSLLQLHNDTIGNFAPYLAPMGLKQRNIRCNWLRLLQYIHSGNEHWQKAIDIYMHYMTYGKTRKPEEGIADYTEMLLLGNSPVELEFFLGNGLSTREKEAKKHLNSIVAAFGCIEECLSKAQILIMVIIKDIEVLSGFLIEILQDKEAITAIIDDLMKTLTQFYTIMLEMNKRTCDFFNYFRHFHRLIIQTIHVFQVLETGDTYNDEEPNASKVLEFLDCKIDKNIFEFCVLNMRRERDYETGKRKPRFCRPGSFKVPGIMKTEGPWPHIDVLLAKFQAKLEPDEADENPDFPSIISFDALDPLIDGAEIVKKAAHELENFYSFPILQEVRLEETEFPLMRPSCAIFQYGMFVDISCTKTFIHALLDLDSEVNGKVFLFEYDSEENEVLGTVIFFTRPIHSCHFFGGTVTQLTVLSFDANDKKEDQDYGRCIMCQIPLRIAPVKGPVLPIETMSSLPFGAHQDYDIELDIPTDITKPGPTTVLYIDQVLPIEDFHPLQFTVSGIRKVGAVIARNKRTVLLLEMEAADLMEDELEDMEDDSFEFSEDMLSI